MILSKVSAVMASLAMIAAVGVGAEAIVSDAGVVEPYPDDFDIGIGEDEFILFAGRWDDPNKSWGGDNGSPFLVESDVPVILNRITTGSNSRLSWAVPWGVSIIVKSDCNNDTEIDPIEIDPVVYTELADLNGQSVSKISVMALTGVRDTISSSPPSIPLAESRMANDDPPEFILPSSDFFHDYECWGQMGKCVPKVEVPTPTQPQRQPQPQTAAPDADSSNTLAATIDTDSVTYGSTTTDGPTGSPIATGTAKNGATVSSASYAKITTNLVLGLLSTVSLLILGTVGIGFDKNQGGRNTMIGVTVVAIFTTIFIAVLLPPAHALSSFGDGDSRSLNDAQHQCTINVEIVYWGCDHEVYIDAPGISLRNGIDESESNWDTCECLSKHRFADPSDENPNDIPDSLNRITEVEISDSSGDSNTNLVYQVSGGNRLSWSCNIAIGRPYRDNTGSTVSAAICDTTNEEEGEKDDDSGSKTERPWSEPSLSFLSNVDSVAVVEEDHSHRLGNRRNRRERQRLGKEWADRALGEHASIASFAAFTLALMSNQAPPDLIRDSLTAAQDELRHAKVSFEIASMLSSGVIEPTALPPSTLQFDTNLTELALGTAREGCIDETLSAIEIAVEYDEFVGVGVGVGGDGDGEGNDDFTTEMLIMETTKTIALEEGNHSVLAWRTIEWICSSSSSGNNSDKACQAAQQQVLNPTTLAEAGEKRFPSSPQARRIWECIWTSLLPAIAVAGNDDSVDVTEDKNNFYGRCSFDEIDVVRDDNNAAAKLSELLADKIVSQVKPDATFGTKSITDTK